MSCKILGRAQIQTSRDIQTTISSDIVNYSSETQSIFTKFKKEYDRRVQEREKLMKKIKEFEREAQIQRFEFEPHFEKKISYYRTVKSGRFPEIKEVVFDQNQQIYNVIFGEANDVAVGNPIRRYENCFHGQAELIGSIKQKIIPGRYV